MEIKAYVCNFPDETKGKNLELGNIVRKRFVGQSHFYRPGFYNFFLVPDASDMFIDAGPLDRESAIRRAGHLSTTFTRNMQILIDLPEGTVLPETPVILLHFDDIEKE